MKARDSPPPETSETNNPFSERIITEQIEDPRVYIQTFSEQILVGETLSLYEPLNIVLLGPQGTGKTMLLNMMRPRVLVRWLRPGAPPLPFLKKVEPFLCVSINLTRAGFHVFGLRSLNPGGPKPESRAEDASSAGDYLAHFLFREFVLNIAYLRSAEGRLLRKWMGSRSQRLGSQQLVAELASLPALQGYYRDCQTLSSLRKRSEDRLSAWRNFLNSNTDVVPLEVRSSKVEVTRVLHELGNTTGRLGRESPRLPLFVVIDQYEELPRLSETFGSELQRILNGVLRSRDPVVFCKIGARPYDWGRELRIAGSEARVELIRDYRQIDLARILARHAPGGRGLFEQFARSVALRRVRNKFPELEEDSWEPQLVLGSVPPTVEARLTVPSRTRQAVLRKLVGGVPARVVESILELEIEPLEIRLAGGWAQSQLARGRSEAEVLNRLAGRPWRSESWRKGRLDLALLQVARLSRRKKLYAGWNTVVKLSGMNISILLLLMAQIWDVSTKAGENPLSASPLPIDLQTEGIYTASEYWRLRDASEQPGGAQRYRLVDAIASKLVVASTLDYSMTNPGRNGFSVREAFLLTEPEGTERGRIAHLLRSCIDFAILEERRHSPRSGQAEKGVRLYLHSVLSPALKLPSTRIGDPIHIHERNLARWLQTDERVPEDNISRFRQLTLPSE